MAFPNIGTDPSASLSARKEFDFARVARIVGLTR
jgi:hypothetical protein